jgi:hypothetical protein
MTSSGIETATFLLVAQCLKKLRYSVEFGKHIKVVGFEAPTALTMKLLSMTSNVV